MKYQSLMLSLVMATLLGCLSCSVTATKTTLPDGTVIEQTSRIPDQPAIDAAVRAAELFRENADAHAVVAGK